MKAEEYIDQINKLDAIIQSREEEYERLVALAAGLGDFSVSERVKSSRNLQKNQDAIARYIDYDRETDKLRERRQAIKNTIERLPSVEYKVICQYYLKDYRLKEIAYHFKKSYDWAKKKKRRALGMVQRMIDEHTP